MAETRRKGQGQAHLQLHLGLLSSSVFRTTREEVASDDFKDFSLFLCHGLVQANALGWVYGRVCLIVVSTCSWPLKSTRSSLWLLLWLWLWLWRWLIHCCCCFYPLRYHCSPVCQAGSEHTPIIMCRLLS